MCAFSDSPEETDCAETRLQAPVGTRNFTLLCYTRSNPQADITWKANDEAPRSGISVLNTVS